MRCTLSYAREGSPFKSLESLTAEDILSVGSLQILMYGYVSFFDNHKE